MGGLATSSLSTVHGDAKVAHRTLLQIGQTSWHGWWSRPLRASVSLLVFAIALGVGALVLGSVRGPWGAPFLPLPITVLGSLALGMAGISEGILLREATRERKDADAQQLLLHSPVAHVLLDGGDRVVSVSTGGELRLRRASNSLVGLPFVALFPTAQEERLAAALASPGLSATEIDLPWNRVTQRPLSLSIVLGAREVGSKTRVAAVLDVSDRARLVEALATQGADLARSNRELERFAYVASHDLQEPLRMVASYTQILEENYRGRFDGDADEFLRYASEGARRMQRLIEDLLSYSRVGRSLSVPSDVSMDRVLQRALEDLRGRVEESGAEVEVASLPSIRGDETELLQLMENLLSNALKFHGASPPRIRIHSDATDTGIVRFEVEDRGIGVPRAEQERIFEPFVRLHSKEEYPGTGIGLAICKKIVERHGGRLWVESSGVPGELTRFVFTLSVARAQPESERQPARQDPDPADQSRAWALIEERLKGLA